MSIQTDDGWVDAAPFAAYARRTIETTGLPWRVYALAVAIPAPTIKGLLDGRRRRLPEPMARRIFGFGVDQYHQLARATTANRDVAAYVDSLHRHGFSWDDVAGFLDVAPFEARRIAHGIGRCGAVTALRAIAAAEAHRLAFPEIRAVAA